MPHEGTNSAIAAARPGTPVDEIVPPAADVGPTAFILPDELQRGIPVSDHPTIWNYATFSGRFGEISARHASATLTLAFRLVLEAQRRNEPAAWVTGRTSAFYPPDAAEAAIDLDALIVVRAPDNRRMARAADALLRSGGFGLIVLDLGADTRGLTPPMQSRLVGLAKKHQTALICLTEKETRHPSIGSLVSIRAEATRTRDRDDRYTCRAQILKDKRRGPGWQHKEVFRGPDGLR
jgi:recombination protein RecA